MGNRNFNNEANTILANVKVLTYVAFSNTLNITHKVE